MDLALNNLQRLICHKNQPTNLSHKFSKLLNALCYDLSYSVIDTPTQRCFFSLNEFDDQATHLVFLFIDVREFLKMYLYICILPLFPFCSVMISSILIWYEFANISILSIERTRTLRFRMDLGVVKLSCSLSWNVAL